MLLPSDLLTNSVMKVYDHKDIQASKIHLKQGQIIKLCYSVVENYIWQVCLDKRGLQAQWGNSVGSHRATRKLGIYPPSMTSLSVG